MDHFDKNNLEKNEKIIYELMKKSANAARPDADFKKQLFAQISQKYYAKEKTGITFWESLHHFFAYSTRFPALVASFVIVILGFSVASSYAYISPNVGQNHRLYTLKKAIEKVEYNLTFSESGKVQKQLEFADRRKDELERSFFNKGEIEPETVKEIVSNLSAAYKLSEKIVDENEKMLKKEEIANISREIINELSAIVDDIEKEKVKVKKTEPVIEDIKKDIENIEDQTKKQQPPAEPASLNTPTTEPDDPTSSTPASSNEPPTTIPIVNEPIPLPSCTNECTSGSRECYGLGYRSCGNFDDDSCSEWSQENICSYGTACVSGSCVATCTSQCTPGQKREVENGYQVCGNYDNDACAEWSDTVIIAPACTNQCDINGNRQCAGSGYQICGDYNNDSCLEWGLTNECNTGQSCEAGSCREVQPTCQNECTEESSRQCSGNGYQICGYFDEDSCLEWGAMNECGAGTSCSSGICK